MGMRQETFLAEKPKANGSQTLLANRQALKRIMFVAHTGTVWEMLLGELSCGSGLNARESSGIGK